MARPDRDVDPRRTSYRVVVRIRRAGIYVAARITGTAAVTDTTAHIATTGCPISIKRRRRHYSGQPALQRDRYCCIKHTINS